MPTTIPLKDRAFGIDVSKHQGMIDWDVIAAHQPLVMFSGIRASISYAYKDAFFINNVNECLRVGIVPMPYHVIYPKESSDAQMANFIGQIGDLKDKVIPVLDVELDHGAGKSVITQSILGCGEIIRSEFGYYPIIYSRALWINDYTSPGSWREHFHWWLAQYYADPRDHEEYPAPTRLPANVLTWLIHQNCLCGDPFGVESGCLDYNRFNGTEIDFKAWVGSLVVEPPPPPDEPKELIDRVARLESWAREIDYKG